MRLSAAFFFSSYSKRTGAGFVIYPLSRQLHRGGRTPADKLQYRESRLRLSVLFLPYPGSPPASPFLSFRFPSRGFGALFPAPPRIPSINNSFLHTIIYRYYCPKNVMAGRTDFVTLPFPFCHLQNDILNTLRIARKKAPGGSAAKRFFYHDYKRGFLHAFIFSFSSP